MPILSNSENTNDNFIYQNLCNRLYHEDNLLSQRTAFFLTVNAFLATALSFVISSKTDVNKLVVNLLPIVGIFFSFFHFAISSRNMRSIEFFRSYISLIEDSLELKIDNALYEFYKSGYVKVKYGAIAKRTIKEGNVSETFPWNTRFLNSSLQIIAIWLPFSIGLFWCVTTLLLNSITLFAIPALYLIIVLLRLAKFRQFSSAKPIPLSHLPYDANSLAMPLPELIDRLIIAEIKLEKIKSDECEKNLKYHQNIYKYYQHRGVNINPEIFSNLKQIHLNIWELESDIRKGNEKMFTNDEIADRALRIRDFNKKRIAVKNKIATEYNFPGEIKYDHASQ